MEENVSKKTLAAMEESYLNDLEEEIVQPFEEKRFVDSGLFVFLVLLGMLLLGLLSGIVVALIV